MSLSSVRALWRVGVLGMGALHTAMACLQQSMGADGLNYLIIGEAYWRGDWSLAINGIWSPLYGLIASGVLALVDPPLHWVFPTVQIVNFGIFALSLLCFELFWRELWAAYQGRSDDGADLLHPWLWWSIGYALFLWSAVNLIEIWSVTPDMLVACAVYLAAAYLVRIASGSRAASTYVGLGTVLGLGYLAKAPLFPLGIVALAIVGLLHRGLKAALRGVALAASGFLLIGGPFLVTLSVVEGRPTFSEVSRFTYLKHVNRIPFPHWEEGVVDGVGTPDHPPRRVHAAPDVYVYSGPVGGAYPPSFDPDYWTEGLRPRVNASEQLNEVANSVTFYFRLFFGAQGAFLGVFVTLAAISLTTAGKRPRPSDGDWALSLWALACFAMYSLVFVTERYVAPFVVLFWAGLASYLRFGLSEPVRRVKTVGGILLATALLVNVLALNLAGLTGVFGFRPPIEARAGQFQDGGSGSAPDVAVALKEAAVETGTDIAYVGYSYTANWAYLAGVRIVAEIWPEQAPSFWTASAAEREEVLERFRESGARYAVAEIRSADPAAEEGWMPLGDTGYLVRRLD